MKTTFGINNATFTTCDTNVSAYHCDVTYTSLPKGESILISAFNPAITRNSTFRIKVPNVNVQATSLNGAQIPSDVICANVTDATDCDLFFTTQVTGYSMNYFYLKPIQFSNAATKTSLPFSGATYQINAQQSITVNNFANFTLTYSNGTTNTFPFSLQYNYYSSYEYDGCAA
jgi:hypothetical protein